MQNRHKTRCLAAVAALATVIAACALVAPRLRGQSPATPPQAASPATGQPSFDVASVKPNKSDTNFSISRQPADGRYSATHAELRAIIALANQLRPNRIVAAPEWNRVLSEHFDVEAKAEGNPSKDQMFLMLQSLLASRFKLAAHRETRELPVYALVLVKAGKFGPQLKPHSNDAKCADPAGPPPPPPGPGEAMPAFCGGFLLSGQSGGFRETGNNVDMNAFALALGDVLDRPVIDRTGLTQLFDISYESAFDVRGGKIDTTSSSDPSGPPSIFTALQEQLGLKLEATKAPVDVLVIDHVEEPTPN